METSIEKERRFIVFDVDPSLFDFKFSYIEQGYFQTKDGGGFRVRIIDRDKAELTKKTGMGSCRVEKTEKVSVEAADFLLDENLTSYLSKRRYYRDGWEVDVFNGPLRGLIIAEFESEDVEKLNKPEWIRSWAEVTDTVTNHKLAKLSSALEDVQFALHWKDV